MPCSPATQRSLCCSSPAHAPAACPVLPCPALLGWLGAAPLHVWTPSCPAACRVLRTCMTPHCLASLLLVLGSHCRMSCQLCSWTARQDCPPQAPSSALAAATLDQSLSHGPPARRRPEGPHPPEAWAVARGLPAAALWWSSQQGATQATTWPWSRHSGEALILDPDEKTLGGTPRAAGHQADRVVRILVGTQGHGGGWARQHPGQVARLL